MKVPLLATDGELAEMSFAIFNYLPVGRIADADTPGDVTMDTVQPFHRIT